MIIVPVGEKTLSGCKKHISKILKKADIVELRLDFLDDISIPKIETLICTYPVLLTLRSKSEGGKGAQSVANRRKILKEIIDLKPAYLDLEFERDKDLVSYAKSKSPKTSIILSFHKFKGASIDVEKKLKQMKKVKAWKYKIACSSTSVIDGIKMLLLMKSCKDFIGISMGARGYITRVLAPVYSQPITYACLNECDSLASGQVSLDALVDLYRYPRLSPKTKVLGIIGTPLSQSPGERVYNSIFAQSDIDSIYLNFELESEELKDFIPLAKKLKLYGLSVTIPHKEEIASFVDQKDSMQKDLLSLNSLQFKKNKIFAINTDGLGALNLLEQHGSVKNKKILIIGAGGTAHGLGFVLNQAGAKVTFMNRTDVKAKNLANLFLAQWRSFSELKKVKKNDYDILIHTTSVGMKDPTESLVPSDILYPNKIVLDVVFNDTKLIQSAKEKKCVAYNGIDFWVDQAALQFRLWHGMEASAAKEKMKKKF